MHTNEHPVDSNNSGDTVKLPLSETSASITVTNLAVPFVSFLPLITEIAKIFNETVEIYQAAQYNKKICRILLDRVQIADTAVRNIKIHREESKEFFSEKNLFNLQRLLNVIVKICKFVEEISQLKGLYKYLNSKNIEKSVKELMNEFDSTIQLLEFSLQVDFRLRADKDNKDIKADIKDFYLYLEDIGSGITDVNQSVSKVFEQINALNTKVNQMEQANSTDNEFLEYNDYEEDDEPDEPIANQNIVHRDIRAENILIIDNDTEKIAIPKATLSINDDEISVESTLIMTTASITVTNLAVPFGNFLPLITDIAKIFNEIVKIYQTAEHNKRICGILLDRVQVADKAVRNIKHSREESSEFFSEKNLFNLQKLLNVIVKIRKFVEEISQLKGLHKYIHAKDIEKSVKELMNEFDSTIQLLEFSLQVDLRRADKDNKDIKADIKDLYQYLGNIGSGITDVNQNVSEIIMQINALNTTMNQMAQANSTDSELLDYNDFEEDDEPIANHNVRKFRRKIMNDHVALKLVADQSSTDEQKASFKRQVKILKKLKECHFIIQFHGLTSNDNKIYLVMEWADYNLREYYQKYGPLEVSLKLRFALDISSGLNYLCAASIVHRDIRAENILITDNDTVKIANFKARRSIKDKIRNLEATLEVIRYCAPEKLLLKNKYDTKCDVYSFGVLLWEIAEEKTPYETFGDDIMKITDQVCNKGYREAFSFDSPLPKEYRELAEQATHPDQNNRPQFSKILTKLQKLYKLNRIKANFITNDTSQNGELPSQIWIKDSIKNNFITDIKWNDLVSRSPVGKGRFGEVFKTHWKKMNKDVVCKRLILDDINAIQHEIQIQTRGHVCENIIRILGITQQSESNIYCIVMEYADGGDLRTYLKENFRTLDWDKKLQLAFDITNGLRYLHGINILHRDLHSKNVVILNGSAKITDFGNSKSLETQTNIHNDVFGMIPYLAPELFKSNNHCSASYSVKSDIYSLGVLFWEISSGNIPFVNISYGLELSLKIINGEREKEIPNTPYDYCKLYTSCWHSEPVERPDIEHAHLKLYNILHKVDENDAINNAKLINETSENQKLNENDSTLIELEISDAINNLSIN
ncbi:18464_t:CDS:2 [Funneliformis geosporum]|uniref:13951_t:CDS:1 n=1 Tax=Funneliformis geosporum TaxID=1117311 RepID=A0A9W4SBH8_9GLOM|nr:18464_t:CDS:2 [Funneliformis geosporum]CAI2163249.1 13951_t:CDS:2 [Funneliformis geosporum]